VKRIIKPLIASAPLLVIIIFLGYKNNNTFITPINDFSIITTKLSQWDNNTLVIFDVDRVLLIETDPYERGHRTERKQVNSIASIFTPTSYAAQNLDRATRDQLWALYVQGLKESLIDDQIPSLITALQERGIKVIALTRFLTGKAGSINHIEDVRIDRLKALGVNFNNDFAAPHPIIFEKFSFENRHPVFKDGMLFTTMACNKGDLLTAFLKTVNWTPSTIIMFDDKLDNLISVRNAARALHIPYEGYQYTAASHLAEYFDKDATEFQMNYLIKNQTWIDRAHAQALLHSSAQPITP
jgi:Protein of unknown function (DUF2608).